MALPRRGVFAGVAPAVMILVGLGTGPAQAAVVLTGDTDPAPGNEGTLAPGVTLFIGQAAPGSFLVDGGSTADSGFSAVGFNDIGTATVTGTGSTWISDSSISVGHGPSGNGTLNVLAGGSTQAMFMSIGNFPGAIGTATVNGTDSSLAVANSLLVGNGAFASATPTSGTLNIEAGAQVTSFGTQLGLQASATGTVNVTGGSSLTNTSSLIIGINGTGYMTLTGGSTVTDFQGTLGAASTAQGTMTVYGAGSSWNNSDLVTIGNAGQGTLSVNNGGLVNLTTANVDFRVAFHAGSTGKLHFGIGDDGTGTVAAGRINIAHRLDLGLGDAIFEMAVDAGTLLNLGDQFILIDYGLWDGQLFSVLEPGNVLTTLVDDALYNTDGFTFAIDYNFDLGGGDRALVATLNAISNPPPAAVPEPASLALLGLGLAGLLGVPRRRRSV